MQQTVLSGVNNSSPSPNFSELPAPVTYSRWSQFSQIHSVIPTYFQLAALQIFGSREGKTKQQHNANRQTNGKMERTIIEQKEG